MGVLLLLTNPRYSAVGQEARVKITIPEIIVFSKEVQDFLEKKIKNYKIAPSPLACTPITYDDCIDAKNINVGSGSSGATTCNATLETGEDIACGYVEGINQSSWFKFTAQNVPFHTVGVVEQPPSGNPCTNSCDGCYISTAVWESQNGACPPSGGCKLLSCQSSVNGVRRQEHVLPNLIAGNVYYFQVMYKAGGVCGDFGNFNVFVSNYRRDTISSIHVTNYAPSSNCSSAPNICNIPSASAPPVATINANCSTSANITRDTINSVVRKFVSFNTGNNTSISFSTYITSMCGNGNWDTASNVSWGYWKILESNCNTIISCGWLGSNTIITTEGLLCNTNYKIFLMYELKCKHINNTVYVFAPNTECSPLPVSLIGFEVKVELENIVCRWQTASEVNSEKFILQKRINNKFEIFAEIPTLGNSSSGYSYKAIDDKPFWGLNFYRLLQKDINGETKELAIKSINFNQNFSTEIIDGVLYVLSEGQSNIEIFDLGGRKIFEKSFYQSFQTKLSQKGLLLIKINEKTQRFFID